MGKLKKNSSPVPHVVGYTSFKTQKILREYGFGQSRPAFGPRKGDSVSMFCIWAFFALFTTCNNSIQQDSNQNEQFYNDGQNEGATEEG